MTYQKHISFFIETVGGCIGKSLAWQFLALVVTLPPPPPRVIRPSMQGYRSGVNAYLSKPFDPEEVRTYP